MGDWDKPAPTPVYAIGFGLLGLFGTLAYAQWVAACLIVFGVFIYVSAWCVCSILHNDGQWIYWSTDDWFTGKPKRDYQACLDSIHALENWHKVNTIELALEGKVNTTGVKGLGVRDIEAWREAGRQMAEKYKPLTADTGCRSCG